MKLIDIKSDFTPIVFNQPIPIGNTEISSKDGYKLTFKTDEEQYFFTELSILKGLHEYSNKRYLDEIWQLLAKDLPLKISFEKIDFKKPFFGIIPEFNCLPYTKWVIEQAFLNYIESYKPALISSFFGEHKVESNKLFIPSPESVHYIDDIVNGFKKSKSKTIKIKLGLNSIQDDIMILDYFIRNTDFSIRVDSNRRYQLDDLFLLAANIDMTKIEYLEEPLSDLSEWHKFYNRFPSNLALDESYRDFNGDYPEGVTAIVLKPSLYGGISDAINAIDEIHKKGLKTVISSTFDGKLGINTLKYLASYQNKKAVTHHGLDTLKYLSKV